MTFVMDIYVSMWFRGIFRHFEEESDGFRCICYMVVDSLYFSCRCSPSPLLRLL